MSFHSYGAIGAELVDWVNQGQVSMPVWCDWEKTTSHKELNRYVQFSMVRREPKRSLSSRQPSVSIPYGAMSLNHAWTACLQCFTPVWCDWEHKTLDFSCHECFNSIWCDWELFGVDACIAVYFVSIPVWCDWERLHMKAYAGKNVFQFQYGAIGRPMKNVTLRNMLGFNSSMVRLGVLAIPERM